MGTVPAEHGVVHTPLVESPRNAWRDGDLCVLLAAVADRHAKRPALVTDAGTLTYEELFGRARRLATLIDAERRRLGGPTSTAVMGSRTAASFVGILGALFAGNAYVPLNPKFPAARNVQMLLASGARTLLVEAEDLRGLADELHRAPRLSLILPDSSEVEALAKALPEHDVLAASFEPSVSTHPVVASAPEALAYVMFTSGSTGVPKGVMVTRRNVLECMASFGDRFAVTEEDRFSQNFDLTFDLSVFDMFLCWLHGAALHVPAPAHRANPAQVVSGANLTIWFSVPSMGLFMEKMRSLRPGSFPSLRWSLFCGERLPASVARAFGAAASNSIVENLYGPTEVTIACTAHRFQPGEDTPELKGSVPIGVPLPGLSAVVVDPTLSPCKPGDAGELCLAGGQVAAGYLDAPGITAERFVSMPWDATGARWYRTGDLVTYLPNGILHHLGRADDQVKIRGYRVELGDIEFSLRKILKTEAVAAIAVPSRQPDVLEIIVFAVIETVDDAAVSDELTKVLPSYMHPAQIISLPELPLNSNGKVDKTVLRRNYLERHANA